MSGNEAEGSAGPALAAHSKDASAPGSAPASAATAPRVTQPAASTGWTEYVRDNPGTAVLWAAGIGMLIGFLLRG